MDGFVIVNKPAGVTSHDCISRLRKLLNTKKIGHTGTLDPFATGVLVCGVGQATKCFQYLPKAIKRYTATIKFGVGTDTLDSTGEVTKVDEGFKLDASKIDFQQFIGDIAQIPPMFSAIKIDGQKMYDLARKGESVELPPRPVHIYFIDVLSENSPENELEVEIVCSPGTYGSSIARDVAKSLGTVGHLSKLDRAESDNFNLSNSQEIWLENNPDNRTTDGVEVKLESIADFLVGLPEYVVTEDVASKLRNGMRIPIDSESDSESALFQKDTSVLAVLQKEDSQKECIAICNIELSEESCILKPVKGFKEGTI